MSDSDTKGQMWPLQLFFLTAGGGGLYAIFGPVPPNATPNWGLASCLIGMAFVAALILYVPRIWFVSKVPDVRQGLNDLQGRLQQIDERAYDLAGVIRDNLNAIAELNSRLATLPAGPDSGRAERELASKTQAPDEPEPPAPPSRLTADNALRTLP
jgi:hypothetical protein